MARQISSQDLANRLAQGEDVRIVDVRQPWESQIATLPDSTLIPLNELAQRSREIGGDPSALVVVFCHHGIRSLSVAAYLERLGYTSVLSLAGGIDAWSCEIDAAVPRY